MARFRIMAHRSAASVMGASSAPVKSAGRVELFDTLAQARTEAERLNSRLASPHVTYTADPNPVEA